MSDLPLCQTCGGEGTVGHVDNYGETMVSDCPAGCVGGRLPVGVYLGPGGNPQTGYLDPAKVILWCETHGGSSGNGKECDWVAAIERTMIGHCRINVRLLGPIVGEPA